MYISEYMRSPAISVTPNTTLDDALALVRQHGIRRLPVVEDSKLVGLVTRRMLREVEAPLLSSIPLSTLGLRYQLSKMKVRDIMITDVITVAAGDTLEEAVTLAERENIGTLPVVDKRGNLVGMVTSTDLYHLITQLLGFGQKGVRLHIMGLGGSEDIRRHQLMEILYKHKVSILSAFNITPSTTQQPTFILHLDAESAESVVEELKELNLRVEVRRH